MNVPHTSCPVCCTPIRPGAEVRLHDGRMLHLDCHQREGERRAIEQARRAKAAFEHARRLIERSKGVIADTGRARKVLEPPAA